MSNIDPSSRCTRCGHTFKEHEAMIASVRDYRHAREMDSCLAECLDEGGFVTEKDYKSDYVPMAASRR